MTPTDLYGEDARKRYNLDAMKAGDAPAHAPQPQIGRVQRGDPQRG